MITITPKVDDLVGRIIGGAIQVHRSLGPGLLESVYRECLTIELTKQGLSAVPERTLPVFYDGQRLASKLRIDLLVDDVVVVEIKAVERFHPVHLAQVITYLKLSGWACCSTSTPQRCGRAASAASHIQTSMRSAVAN